VKQVQELKVDNIDDLDKKLLQELQDNFPVVEKPWERVSSILGITENEVLQRLERLTKAGMIHKIGAIIDSAKIGLAAATLIAMSVPDARVTDVAKIINEYSNVSHNYLRDDQYNIWFTITAATEQEVDSIVAEILAKTGIEPSKVLNLPTEERFKINVRFRLA
jgi:siroheme decarboxylase